MERVIMRDPRRIHDICTKLEVAWSLSPDQRLGQFISNLLGPGSHDVFYPEDTEWEQLLDAYITNEGY